MAKVGDNVRFLNAIGGGHIVRIEGNIAYVEDSDGFEIPVLTKECVIVDNPHVNNNTAKTEGPNIQTVQHIAPEPPLDTSETPSGDIINIVLGYEPTDVKQLGSTTYNTYIVNDSNYYLYFSYMTQGAKNSGWTTRYAGIVEPNIQLLIDTLTTDVLPSIERIAIQYIAFKQTIPFSLKKPALVEYRFDPTRFFKLHCFHDNPYFDNPVISYDIVKDDVAQRQHKIDGKQLEKAMMQKKNADLRPVIKRQIKKSAKRNGEIIEVDLHIHELIDNTNGLGAADMLNVQIDEFRRVMDENLKNHGQRIVFIHGKGEGVLRNSIMKELNHRYKGHRVQDASFGEYGFGATQVTIV